MREAQGVRSVSTIEEAREQAREALELIHTWAQREQAWDTPRALGFEKIGQAIRTLLDATEPQEAVEPAEDEREPHPITDEMVEAAVDAAWNKRTVGIGGQVVYGPPAGLYRMVRAALEAAEEARR